MRPLIALLLAALVMLQFKLWVSDDGARKVWRLQEQIRERTEENDRLAQRNAELEAEVQDLRKGLAAAEERARSELGFVKPDESFYEIVTPPDDGK
jgi:cell division protein FtsB